MADQEIDKLRFPVGEFQYNDSISDAELNEHFENLANLPDILLKETATLTEDQLNTPADGL